MSPSKSQNVLCEGFFWQFYFWRHIIIGNGLCSGYFLAHQNKDTATVKNGFDLPSNSCSLQFFLSAKMAFSCSDHGVYRLLIILALGILSILFRKIIFANRYGGHTHPVYN